MRIKVQFIRYTCIYIKSIISKYSGYDTRVEDVESHFIGM